jgi:hypothetical protein
MDVQIRGRAERFADLLPGAFFCALRANSLFGLCVTTLKAELSPVAAMSGSPPYGAIISTGEDYYIRASAGLGHAVKFNLSTGMIAELPTPTTSIIFPNWQIGHTENHKFEPVFTFPEYL